MSRKMLVLMCSIFLIVPLLFMGCTGDDGSTGATGATGPTGPPGEDLTATAKPETCVTCHSGAGDNHQADYDLFFQDGVIKVTIDNAVVNPADNTVAVNFHMTKGNADFNCKDVDNLNIYFTQYDNTLNRFQFASGQDRLSIKGTPSNIVYKGSGLCTSTAALGDNAALLANPGVVVVYGYDEQLGSIAARVRQVAYPYADLLFNAAYKALPNPYVSASTVTGCEKCHTIPYLKHGNIYGRVKGVAATDMITCKACHLDNGEGGHQVWQLLVDDTVKAGDYWAVAPGDVESEMTPAELAKYAYKTRLMNDVHMSHAMEFEYPQSMANCNTCHAGKLDKIFTDNNFVLETCKSCHPETGSAQAEKMQGLGLAAILPSSHITGGLVSPARVTCSTAGCHAGQFKTITGHTGYNKIIYATDNGVKYSDIFKVTIDNNASFDNNLLTFSFHATGTLGGLVSPNIKPTVLVGLYGYDTKDYIAGPHERTIDTARDIEYVVGTSHPRFTTDNTTAAGSWKVTANLSNWAKLIADGVVRRVEIGVIPTLRNADNNIVALNAPSRTFNLGTKTFTDSFYPAIVNVIPNGTKKEGCNNCHDALAVNFHDPDRGGNIVICRLCHITKQGGSHLEMQSRSIDSYAHAIHTFQDFDIGDIDFDNNVESMFHDLKIESTYPTFGTTNCVSCHNAGRFNAPAQDKSMAGILSPSDNVAGRAINQATATGDDVPAYVTGPGSRACGACHRAVMIKEDQAAELASFNQHTKDGGYLLVPGTIATLETAINAVLPTFNDGDFVDITP